MQVIREILYCFAISFQLSGALLIICNSYNTLSRSNLIKNFLKNSFTIKLQENSKENILNYNHEAFLDFIHLQDKNFISFLYIFIGYILGVLGEIHNKKREIIFIILLTISIIWITTKFIKYKNRNIKKITLEELENLNINPTIETADAGDIEGLFYSKK